MAGVRFSRWDSRDRVVKWLNNFRQQYLWYPNRFPNDNTAPMVFAQQQPRRAAVLFTALTRRLLQVTSGSYHSYDDTRIGRRPSRIAPHYSSIRDRSPRAISDRSPARLINSRDQRLVNARRSGSYLSKCYLTRSSLLTLEFKIRTEFPFNRERR